MTSRPTPAKLQLLVRGDDNESFELREIGSSLGFIQSRPQRVAEGSFEISEVKSPVEGERTFILKNLATNRFLLLSGAEKFLWEQMDGHTSLQEIATAYVLKYGEFDFDIIPNLIRKLQRAQLLTMMPKSRLRKVLARNRKARVARAVETTLTGLERIKIYSRKVQTIFAWLYRWGGFLLFTRAATILVLALGVVGGVATLALLREAGDVFSGFGGHAVRGVLVVKLLFFASVALHQAVHALACIHYQRRVHEFGFTFLHGFVPTFYVDVTDIFMASRRARVVTAVSGTLVHLVLGATCFLIAAYAPMGGFTQAFAATSGILQWQAFAFSLYPFCFIEMDGYHVFVDLLGVPTLKHDSIAYLKALLTGRARLHRERLEGLWLGYVALSALSIAAFIAFNVWIIVTATS